MTDPTRRQVVQAALVLAAAGQAGAKASAAMLGPDGDADALRLGCCYYPEQWDESRWKQDATDMVARGLSRVRIAEFAWTLMEPEAGRYDWGWLDRAVDTLSGAGLGVVMGTPTACPPEWMVARYPEILPVAKDGQVKGFGSRRYYSFSSLLYRRECARIAKAMADRYGRHKGVVGWQIDNEYGCHDTTYSYGAADLAGFRTWLRARYGTIARLNKAWGTVVWSQQSPSFEAIGLPTSSPYDFPPDMLLDYRRFASEQVMAFHKVQADVIRPLSPGRFITTNFMANFTEFDHYPVGQALDMASWDSYPLGVAAGKDDARWDRTGNPDLTGWNHDLVRGLNPAPFWIMEQQPGPVNWARYNPAPLPGMVRLWTWEAFAHGAGTVSYFRWRQGQVGPEQMHSGLNRPDGHISAGGEEAAQVAKEIARIGPIPKSARGDVALLFDYETVWMTEIQPNGSGQDHLVHAQSWYAALRKIGLNVDIVRAGTPVAGYKLVVVPSVWTIDEKIRAELAAANGLVVIGPRSGSKTADFAIPGDLPPGPLQSLVPVKVKQVAIARAGTGVPVTGTGITGQAMGWREWLETALPVLAHYDDGEAAVMGSARIWYVGCQGDAAFTGSLLKTASNRAGLKTYDLPDGVRLQRRGALTFALNYGPRSWTIPEARRRFVLGGKLVGPQQVSAWRDA
ncbi:beta-galactosidase [Sphingomonas sp. BIUV-7]|uniref:Beta-galactosidase n=1 Tax=Sphingomonas natans TaxID=3063330 RepID=A0ABT8YAT0_9SPHN|nr:beta-galactosidase [Sphingomonas sp. BIUV-7]MDO6414943.1 beta-galactosidase [Sphingomonas sp. BIUV-7]